VLRDEQALADLLVRETFDRQERDVSLRRREGFPPGDSTGVRRAASPPDADVAHRRSRACGVACGAEALVGGQRLLEHAARVGRPPRLTQEGAAVLERVAAATPGLTEMTRRAGEIARARRSRRRRVLRRFVPRRRRIRRPLRQIPGVRDFIPRE
jgi:hypothetical protein